MLSTIVFLTFLAAPIALMWWLLRVQRRMRALPRKAGADMPETPAYTDGVRGADGLVYGRAFDVNDELLAATRRSDEPSDVKNLQGQR